MSSDRRWDSETDLLVIGAGAAGMTAALVGKLEGLDVILCEKSDLVGGTTATSAGSVWIPGSSQSRKAGTGDPIDAAKLTLPACSAKTCGAKACRRFWPRARPRSTISNAEPASSSLLRPCILIITIFPAPRWADGR